MGLGRLQHLWGKEVRVHLNYENGEGWILRRYAKVHKDIRYVKLKDVRFVVDEEAWQHGLDVATDKHKILSGWAEGTLVSIDVPGETKDLNLVDYFPKKYGYFLDVERKKSVHSAKLAYFHHDRKMYCQF